MTEQEFIDFDEWASRRKYDFQRNGKVRDCGRRPRSTKDILSDWKGAKGLYDKYFAVDEDDIQDYINWKINQLWPEGSDGDDGDNDSEVTSIQAMMLDFLEQIDRDYEFRLVKSAFILYQRGLVYAKQVKIKKAATNTRLKLMSEGRKVLPDELCVSLVEKMLEDKTDELREEALGGITYDPYIKDTGFSFKKWTQKLFSYYGIDDTKLNRVMWKYFMHSIKRAAFGLIPSENRLFFLIFSRIQGIGKTRLLRHLCDPFAYAFNESVNLSLFSDKTAIKAFATSGYALADFQELGLGSGKSSVTASADLATTMKAVITLDVDKSRELFTTSETAALMQTVFASSTNLHISDVIQDEQYRRYYTFNSNLTREEALARDWSEVDEFFNTTIYDAYRFLNENELPSLDLEMAKELREEQLTYRRRTDLITQWLREEGLEIHDAEDEGSVEGCVLIDRNSLYRKFKTFTTKNGYPNYSSARMQQLIATSLDILAIDKTDGKTYYCIKDVKNAER